MNKNNMTIIFDIETRPNNNLLDIYLENLNAPSNYKDEKKIKEYLEEKKLEARKAMSVDTDYAEIICIGIKEEERESRLVSHEEFASLLPNNTFVSFNGKKFDVPVIIKEFLRNNINADFRLLKDMMQRYSTNHIDLIETISQGGQFKSLDKYLQIYLGIKKTPIDFNTASEEEIKRHCLEDVDNSYKLYNLFKPII